MKFLKKVLMKVTMKQQCMTSDEELSDSGDSDISDHEISSYDSDDDATSGIWACLIGDDPGPVPVPFTATPGPIHSPGVDPPPPPPN